LRLATEHKKPHEKISTQTRDMAGVIFDPSPFGHSRR
jgi:hypothetical protein